MGHHGVQGRVGGPTDDKLLLRPSRSGQQSVDQRIERGIAASAREGSHGICPLSPKLARNVHGVQSNCQLCCRQPIDSVKASARTLCGCDLLPLAS